MSNQPETEKSKLPDTAKALGSILAIPLTLFAIVEIFLEQPTIAIFVSLFTAVFASVWGVNKK